MDEPTSSLSEAETETLFNVIRKLVDRNIAIIYISHKLDEVMFLSDRITVIRDGKNIISKDKDQFTQDELIANMIGRPLENLYLEGARRDHHPHAGGQKPDPQGRVPGHLLHRPQGARSWASSAWWALYAARSCGPFSASTSMTPARCWWTARSSTAAIPPPPSPRASASAPRTGRREGLALRLSILLNMTLVRLPLLSKLGVIQRKAQRAAADEYMKSISIKAPSVNQLVGNPLRRQPAEGGRGQVA